jgi:hypothetical protein
MNNLNTARARMAPAGTYTAAIVFGGTPTAVAITEEWNGASWVETSDLSTARSELAGAGTSSAGLAFGGQTGSPNVRTTATEEWSVPSSTIKVLTD